MNTQIYHGTSFIRSIILTGLLLCSGCGAFSDQTLVTDSAVGAVYLQQLSNRGTTAAFSGPLKSFKASHPITLAPDILAKALAGLQIGIIPTDEPNSPRGIKPTPVFSPREIAFLAPAVATALKQAHPDQRVKFQTGSRSEATDGTIYVDGTILHIALTHYRSPGDRRDEQLPIYTLSFSQLEAQAPSTVPQTWMEVETNQPKLALAIPALSSLPAPVLPPVASSTNPQNPQEQAPSADQDALKIKVDKQAQELDALKAELDALKKQMGSQADPLKSAPSSK